MSIFSPQEVQGIGMTSQRTRDRMIQRLRQQGIVDSEVLSVMASVPRHLFLDEAMAHRAYEDCALPIGFGQTLSQPLAVACMTAALREQGRRRRILEIGSGSGYQGAVLSRLPGVKTVYTVERIGDLLSRAQTRWKALQYNNIYSRHVDGGIGWMEEAPFDGVMVTCAMERIPTTLLEQMSVGGCLVAPVSLDGNEQRLVRITATLSQPIWEDLGPVRFVPFLAGSV